MSQFKIPSQEISQPHGAPWPFDPAFKLFGKTIPVLSPVAAAIDGGAPKDAEESVITSADSIAVSSMQDEGDEQSLSEDEGEAVFVPDELGSFSGSNDGGDQEKFSPESRAAGVENSAGVSNVQGSEIMARGDDTGDDNKEEEDHGHEAQDGMPRKPDKPLPCPRCESLDTKFCYFNNYNVNQPRHFCKNCQRYWTAGGTLRNVPVGAGRRKHKHSSSHQRNVLPDGVAVRSDAQDTAQQLLSCSITPAGALNSQLNLSPSASMRHLLPLDVCSVSALDSPSSSTTILSFGQESPLCESMAAASLNPHRAGSLQGQGLASGKAFGSVGAKVGSSREIDTDMKTRYGCKLQMKNDISSATEASHETNPSVERQPMAESVCGSSVTTQWGNAKETGVSESPWDSTGFCEPLPPTSDVASSWPNAPPFAFFNAPWQYGYNIGWNNPAAAAAIAAPSANVPMVNGGGAHSASPSVPNPACAPAYPSTWNGGPASIWAGIPWPLMQSPVWGPAGWNGTWSIPWSPAATAAAVAAAAAAASTSNSGLTSPTLGKHPRERPHTEGSTEGSLWIPKTLRIDDPGEAARSSIWTTLGLGTRPESFTSGGIFKAFQPKTDVKDTEEPPLQARHTNPAAMTRSMAFQESS